MAINRFVIFTVYIEAATVSPAKPDPPTTTPSTHDSNPMPFPDVSTLYRDLDEMRDKLQQEASKPPEESYILQTIKEAVKTVLDTIIDGFKKGFVHRVERKRRQATDERKTYLDSIVYVVGSMLGKRDCSNMIACRSGKFVQRRLPGAQLIVMMVETVVPQNLQDWYNVLKTSVLERADNCDESYDCSLTDEQLLGSEDLQSNKIPPKDTPRKDRSA
uniref:Uncharacterized protein n=1 Tax=Pseudodiaptomus poplesia TaxID=213370 RepID=A0A0U2V753_9MAXI|nr:hypothetical protein [Pseudodiaptomus poplesia]